MEETHAFRLRVLNTARFGFSRAGYFFTGEPTPGTPAASAPSFVAGHPDRRSGRWRQRGVNPATQLGLAGSNNGSNLHMARNLFTYEDQVTLTHGIPPDQHRCVVSAIPIERKIALSQFGQGSFTGLAGSEAGTISTFLYDPAPTEMNWRSLFGGVVRQDEIRFTPKLTVSLGFRDEFSTGWNEAHGRAANYTFHRTESLRRTRTIGNSGFTVNNANFLPQPRVGTAWSPLSQKDGDSRRLRNVQRFAGRAGIPHGPERAFQSHVYPF